MKTLASTVAFATVTVTATACATVTVTALIMMVSSSASAQAQVPAQGSYAFTSVNVIPMDQERVLDNQTVLVEGNRITEVGPASEVFIPSTAIRIDGRGKFLMPGLAEMHGHLPTEQSEAEDFLLLYLAGGATTVRGMLGHPSQLAMRERVQAGDLAGPRMWLAAPALRGSNVPDTDTADRLVRQARADGYDLLKIHEGLSADVYAAIVRAANEINLPFGGHVPDDVGVPAALAAGQDTIDHLDNYLEAMQPPRSPALAAEGADRQRLLAVHANRETIDDLAKDTRRAGVAIVPTQMLWEVLRGNHDPDELASLPELRYMPRATREAWYSQARNTYNQASRLSASREAGLRQELLAAMNEEGVLILLGTDAPQVFSVPGFSLHRELPLMVASGMTAYEVLRTGTVNVAAYFGNEADAGTVTAGKFADLLLLNANPLTNINAVADNAGVMFDGRWLAPAMIEARLAAIAAKYRSP